MAKFKVGDRVRCVMDSHRQVPVGSLGTVMEEDTVPYVKWDGGLTFRNSMGNEGEYALLESELEFICGALTVDTCIALYRGACEQFELAQSVLAGAELALEKAKAAVQDARLNLRDALDGET